MGVRRIGRCDVPDLDLLPQRFAGVKTVSFHAGFASSTAHQVVEQLALQVKARRLKSALPFARTLYTLGRWMQPVFSDRGAMFVKLEGLHDNGARYAHTWNLVARENDGPNIPCAASIALANKIAAGGNVAGGRDALHGAADGGGADGAAEGTQHPRVSALGPGGQELG